MRSIDRARRDGIRWTGDYKKVWAKVNEGTVDLLGKGGAAQIIVADDVASWRFESRAHEDTWDAPPDVRLPYDSLWIEYPSFTGRERRCLLISNETGYVLSDALAIINGETPPERDKRPATWYLDAVAEALRDANANGCHDVQAVITSFAYIDDLKRVYGPVGISIYVLGEHGRIMGNRWLFLGGDRMAAALAADDTSPEDWLQAASDVGLWTVALMNMRNVTTEEVRPPIVRRHRRRGNLPPARYHVLRVKLPGGRLVRLSGSSVDGGEPVGLHDVRGHPAHYGDCCPGAHPPNKQLFGRLTGVYWIPAHMRGSKEAGVIEKDYEAEVDRDGV